jgi:hypothetical protein
MAMCAEFGRLLVTLAALAAWAVAMGAIAE